MIVRTLSSTWLGAALRCLAVAAVPAWLAAVPSAHAADGWQPERPVRFVVPYAPGGAADVAARAVGQALQTSLSQPWVIDNKPGAGGNIGAEYTFHAKADGSVFQLGNIDINALNVHLYPSMRSKIEQLTAVTPIARVGMVLTARAGLAARNLQELVALSQRQNLSYASWGIGSSAHLGMLVLAADQKMPNLLHVPYAGAGPAMQALLKGEVDLMIVPTSVALAYRENRGLNYIGVAELQRSAFMKDVPTLKEQGGPDVDMSSWMGIVAPPSLPPEIAATVARNVATALKEPKLAETLRAQALLPFPPMSPQEFRAFINGESARWAKVIRDAQLKLE